MKETDVLKLDQGDPAFLQYIFRDLLGVIEPIIDFSYPEPGGDPELLEQLNKIFPQYSRIVVTNGATQGLCGALEYFSHKHKSLFCPTPYWSRIPTICSRAGMFMGTEVNSIFLVTSPDNPSGKIHSFKDVDIWDASYANPFYEVYGNNIEEIPSKCAIYSSSKMLGVAGYRVGWVLTNDDELADYITDFVDYSTIGVSIPSQKEVANLLRHVRGGRYNKGFELAKKTLEKNHVLLEHKLGDYFESLNSNGLFGWFKVKDFEKFDDALFNGHISVMSGKAFGATEDGWYRLNLGGRQDVVDAAIDRLSRLLSK